MEHRVATSFPGRQDLSIPRDFWVLWYDHGLEKTAHQMPLRPSTQQGDWDKGRICGT